MRLQNSERSYGAGTRGLHWLTVIALVGQFVIGYTMSADDAALNRAEDRLDAFEERMEDEAEARGEEAEEQLEREIERREDALDDRKDNYVADAFSRLVSGDGFRDGLSRPELHVLVGLCILTLGVVRLAWRRSTALPPWASYLSAAERTLEAWLEKSLLAMLFIVPGTGLLLVAADDDWLPVHVGAQIALFAVVALHVGLVIKHTVWHRHRHLARML